MRCFVVVFGGLVVLSARSAAAEPQESGEPYLAQHLQAPVPCARAEGGDRVHAGHRDAAPTRSISDASGAGLGMSIDVDARLSPPARSTTFFQCCAATNSGS